MEFRNFLKQLTIIWIAFAFYQLSKLLKVLSQNEMTGKIEGCSSDFKALKNTNLQIAPFLQNLTETRYFRTFQVNLQNNCPFWAQKLICSNPLACGVCECDDDEIPSTWKNREKTDLVIDEGSENMSKNCIFYKQFQLDDLWQIEDPGLNGVYVDLEKNKESFTGYDGSKIWKVIYEENQFNNEIQCEEEKMLNKIISGLHSSISTHLCEYYETIQNQTSYKNNHQMYFEKVGNHPQRISNLFYLYSILLRALNLLSQYIDKNKLTIDSGNYQKDQYSIDLIKNLTKHTIQCEAFDERQIFAQNNSAIQQKQFMTYFQNISKIMDCVECEKCKTYGKMQVYGIGTALRIIFSYKQNHILPQIKRNEFIAFLNTFAKISKSVQLVDIMHERKLNQAIFWFKIMLIPSGAYVIFLYIILHIKETLPEKIRKQYAFLSQHSDL